MRVIFLLATIFCSRLCFGQILFPILSGSPAPTVTVGTPNPTTNTTGTYCDSCSSLKWSHVIGSSVTNGLVVVGVSIQVSSGSDAGCSVSATANGTSMTGSTVSHINGGTVGFTQLFSLTTGSTTGPIPMVVTMSGCSFTAFIMARSLSFSSVNQSTPVQNANTASGVSTSPSVVITSAANHMVVDSLATDQLSATSGQTMRVSSAVDGGASSTATGAASVTMSYTITNGVWAMSGLDIVPSSGSVDFDAVGAQYGASCTNCTSLSWTAPCPGPNGALFIYGGVGAGNDAGISLSATFNGVSWTSRAGPVHTASSTAGFIQGWFDVCSGTHTVQITESGAAGSWTLTGGSLDFANVNQATPIVAAHTATNTDTAGSPTASPSVTVTSSSGNLVIDAVGAGTSFVANTQTWQFLINRDDNTGGDNSASSTAAGAGSVTSTYTLSQSDFWAVLGLDVNRQ